MRVELSRLAMADWWQSYSLASQWREELRIALHPFLVAKAEDWDALEDEVRASYRNLCIRLRHPIPGIVDINPDVPLPSVETSEVSIDITLAQTSGSNCHLKGKEKSHAVTVLQKPTPRASIMQAQKGHHRALREPSSTPAELSKHDILSKASAKTPVQEPRDSAKAERDRQQRLSWAKPQSSDTILVPPVCMLFNSVYELYLHF